MELFHKKVSTTITTLTSIPKKYYIDIYGTILIMFNAPATDNIFVLFVHTKST